MNNEYNITVNKKNEKIENFDGNKDKKLKYKNYINSNNDYNIINEEKVQYINNNKSPIYKSNNNEFNYDKNKRSKNEKIFIIKNDNDIMTYFSKSHNNNKEPIKVSHSKPKQKREYTDNIDLIYILSTQKRENENTLDDDREQLTSCIGIPFCHYHRFNGQLPKQYICNFKNCNCYECVDMGKSQKFNDNNKPDYIYPINKTKKSNFKFRSVLDKYKKNKKMSTLSEDANQLGSFCLNILKPNDANIKISKKNYIDNNILEDENEKDYSLNESSFFELPFDCNDDKNLKNYQNLVSKTDKKSKIHLSVMYYKRLNKSYNQVYSKDLC